MKNVTLLLLLCLLISATVLAARCEWLALPLQSLVVATAASGAEDARDDATGICIDMLVFFTPRHLHAPPALEICGDEEHAAGTRGRKSPDARSTDMRKTRRHSLALFILTTLQAVWLRDVPPVVVLLPVFQARGRCGVHATEILLPAALRAAPTRDARESSRWRARARRRAPKRRGGRALRKPLLFRGICATSCDAFGYLTYITSCSYSPARRSASMPSNS